MLVQPLAGSGTLGKTIAEAVVARQYELHPELEQRFGPEGRAKCFQDASFHVAYLLEAAEQKRPDVFVAYTSWVKSLLQGFGITGDHLAEHFRILRDVVTEHLDGDRRAQSLAAIDAALTKLPDLAVGGDSYIVATNPLRDLANDYLSALLERRRGDAVRMITDAAHNGTSVRDIYLLVFQPVQREIGRQWQMGTISVAQEHYGTAATQLVMSQLYSFVFSSKRIGKTFVAACVGDELHEIGMRMVADFVEMEGWDTVYLGANLPVSEIVKAVVENGADALGLSATLAFHAGRVEEIIAALRASPETKNVFVMVGGYAFGEGGGDWRKTGADAYAVDAQDAVSVLVGRAK